MSTVARRYYQRGRQALDNGDLESAQEALRAALDLAPGFGNARIAYAIALARAGDCPRAAQVLRAGIGRALSPIGAAAMHATLGDVLVLGGDFFGAEDAFQQAAHTPGFEAREIKHKLGLRGQATAELFLTGVRVPDSARLGEVGQGFKIAMGTLDKGRLAVASGCVGIVQGCLEASVAYATQRTQFGKPIASFQLVQDLIADMSVDADAARLLAWRCADLIDRGEPFGVAASKAKLFASEAAHRAADKAMQILASKGYRRGSVVERLFRDVRATEIYQGTSEVQRMVIAEHILS